MSSDDVPSKLLYVIQRADAAGDSLVMDTPTCLILTYDPWIHELLQTIRDYGSRQKGHSGYT